jgi:hypothetical protein
VKVLTTSFTVQGFAPEAVTTSRGRQPWPANLPDQVRAIKDVMRSSAPLTPQQIASTFRPASRTRVTEILETLTALGQARVDGDRYSI